MMAGDPDLGATEKLVYEFEKNGAGIIELGIPFSDSIADGPTIVEAANRAINNGVDASKVIDLVKKIRQKSNIPLVFMTSYNILFKYGVSKFIIDAGSAGVDGLILPDLPIEESPKIISLSKNNNIDVIFLLAPNSSLKRIKAVSKASGGFIYLMSVTGITGARKQLSDTIGQSIRRIRSFTSKPIAIGFGISTPEQAKKVSKYADGVIVGSAVVNLINKNRRDAVKLVKNLSREIR